MFGSLLSCKHSPSACLVPRRPPALPKRVTDGINNRIHGPRWPAFLKRRSSSLTTTPEMPYVVALRASPASSGRPFPLRRLGSSLPKRHVSRICTPSGIMFSSLSSATPHGNGLFPGGCQHQGRHRRYRYSLERTTQPTCKAQHPTTVEYPPSSTHARQSSSPPPHVPLPTTQHRTKTPRNERFIPD